MKKIPRRDFVKTGMIGTAGILLPGHGPSVGEFSTEKICNIVDFGAIGNGKSMNTKAIQKAVDECSNRGGGKLVVPAGIFLTGSICLKSNIHLFLEKGAVLLASKYIIDFPEKQLLSECRYQQYLRRALLFAQGAERIYISGEGLLDGNFDPEGGSDFVEKDEKNPPLLWFDACMGIHVKEITLRRSVWWTCAFSRCSSIRIDGIKITENYSYNADGCDFLDCKDFLIEHCDINTNDDGICLKGYTNEGCSFGLIRHNRIRSLCNAIKMGTDSSGGFRNITIVQNEVWQTGISGLALEMVDGGTMENIVVTDLTMNGVATPLFIRLGNRDRRVSPSLEVPKGTIRDIRIRNLKARVNKPEKYNDQERRRHNYDTYASSISGLPGYDMEDIILENVEILVEENLPQATMNDVLREIPEAGQGYPENRMFGKLPSFGFFIRHIKRLRMDQVRIINVHGDARPAFILEDTHDSVFRKIALESKILSTAFSIRGNCSNIQIDTNNDQ